MWMEKKPEHPEDNALSSLPTFDKEEAEYDDDNDDAETMVATPTNEDQHIAASHEFQWVTNLVRKSAKSGDHESGRTNRQSASDDERERRKKAFRNVFGTNNGDVPPPPPPWSVCDVGTCCCDAPDCATCSTLHRECSPCRYVSSDPTSPQYLGFRGTSITPPPPPLPTTTTTCFHAGTFPCSRRTSHQHHHSCQGDMAPWGNCAVKERPHFHQEMYATAHQHCPTLAFEYFYWRYLNKTNGISPDYEELREKIQRLERDKETLALQVQVLNEQIDAQNEKIRDAEIVIRERRERTDRAEELLQREMALRSSLENQKQTLMSEISHLKMRVSTLEKDKLQLQDKVRNNKDFSSNMWNTEQADGWLSKPPTPDPSNHLALGVNEIEKMKRALESVMAANDEKDRKIEELRGAMMRYKRIQDRMLQNKKDDSIDATPVTTYSNFEPARFSPVNGKLADKPPLAPRPVASSTPLQSKSEFSSSDQVSPSMNLGCRSVSPSPHKLTSYGQGSEETLSQPPKTPPSRSRSSIEHYGTVPRNYAPLLQAELSSTLPSPSGTPTKSKTSFGKGFLKFKSGSRSSSAPNLAQTEVVQHPQAPGSASLEHQKEKKGLKRIFGKLRRSNSQTMEGEDSPTEFQRGGLRATAGARLGWSRNLKGDKETSIFYDGSNGTIDVPFARWDTDEIIAWMHELGLTSYVSECKRWLRNGDQLLKATPADLEKELGMKNYLHRKKLTLALRAIGSNGQDTHKNLDHYWVQRWLDDVGLPQYKDSFMDARIDGRMLHHLTAEDLTQLKVSSLLHVTSLRQGIQVLRFHDFDPNCLKRRSSPLEPNPPPPSEVALWTNHRVMEWLRSVDLSEYAPNLRGSGVHGALMIFEPRFSAELLATLLSIPPNKTLLRRHLNTQFKELIGSAVMQQKREKESEPGYTPLTPSTKVKVMKKSQFSIMRKRGKAEMEIDDFVCPFENQDAKVVAEAAGITAQANNRSSNGSVSEHPEKDKKAAREIGAVSKEINCLTDMLQNEKMFASMAASNV